MLQARGAAQERQLYSLWVMRAAISERDWQRLAQLRRLSQNRRRRTDLRGFQRDNNFGEVDADDLTDQIPIEVSANGQREYAHRDIPYHGSDARWMQRAGYGRESTDRQSLVCGEGVVDWSAWSQREACVAGCRGREDFTRAVEPPSTSSAATRSELRVSAVARAKMRKRSSPHKRTTTEKVAVARECVRAGSESVVTIQSCRVRFAPRDRHALGQASWSGKCQ